MKRWLLISIVAMFSCKGEDDYRQADALAAGMLPELNRQLTNVIMADIFTPPVASRIYAYSNIATYEVLQVFDTTYISLQGQLNGLDNLSFDKENGVYPPLAALSAFTKTAEILVYSPEKVMEIRENWLKKYKDTGLSERAIQTSVAYGEKVAAEIKEWASKDGYSKRTSYGGYQVNEELGTWKPTAPDFMEAIEPNWKTLRTFRIDSASQFNPGGPTVFDTVKDSDFYKGAMEVYEAVVNGNDEKLAIARFWDCNPNISYTQGHVMMYRQQNSPGGHWIHIAAQVVEKEKLPIMAQSETFALVSLTLADAFISCWEEKYNSNLIRPQTYINNYIDSAWVPALQTPAFPEHTSGHSVASASAATVLTHLYGEAYSFTDSTEVPFGLPARSYGSFYSASDEAAISRFYGGIHYMPAIEKGVDQGKQLARYILENISLRR